MGSAHFVLCTLGTHGDILPFAALAAALAARDERVTLLSNANWEPLARGAGAHFQPIAPRDPAQCQRNDFEFFEANVLPSFRHSFDHIDAIHGADPRVVVVYKMGMHGAQCAAEKLGLPHVKVALQPAAIRSVHRPAWPLTRLSTGRMRRATRPLVSALYLARELTSRYRPRTNRLRRSLGLRGLPLGAARRTEDLTLVMCPSWFAMPQMDWPPECHCCGFPFAETQPLDPGLREFIERAGAPLVFTPGTGVIDTRGFFDAAWQTCASLRMPGVFLGKDAGKFSGGDIEGREFTDLGGLLPHTRLLVHHGGIGTTAQALRAGIPQLVIPGRFDQPDNAMRIATLRLGAVALGRTPNVDHWRLLIESALRDATLRARLAIASRDVRATDAAARAASLLQRLATLRLPAPCAQLIAHQSAG